MSETKLSIVKKEIADLRNKVRCIEEALGDLLRIVSEPHDTPVKHANVEHILQGHSEWVTSVAFSPDGKRIVSGSSDTTLCVYDAVTGERERALRGGHSYTVTSVAFSPDSKRIVSASNDSVRVWNVDSDEVERTFGDHSNWNATSASFSPDGKRVVSGSCDGMVRVYNADAESAEYGACERTLKGHTDHVTSVAFSLDGTRIVSGSYDRTLRVWNAESGECALTLKGDSDWSMTRAAYSPDSTRIAVVCSNDVHVYSVDGDTSGLERILSGHSECVTSVAFSPDGTRIVSGSDDKTVRIWRIESGECEYIFSGHHRPVQSVAFSPDGKRIVSGSYGSAKVCVQSVTLREENRR